jgi:hypothetical protein
MQTFDNQPSTRRRKWTAAVAVFIYVGSMFGLSKLKFDAEITGDYRKFTAPSEADLIYTSVSVVSSSLSPGTLRLALPDGREISASFVEIPVKLRSRSHEHRGPGAFKGRNAFDYACPNMHVELLWEKPKTYWIYAIDCDGATVLTYADTMRYLQEQLVSRGVRPENYGPITQLVMKLL